MEEEGFKFFEIPLDDGKTVLIQVQLNDTLRDFRERLLTAGVTWDIFDGKDIDDETNVHSFFAAVGLSSGFPVEQPSVEEENYSVEEKPRDLELCGLICAVMGCQINKIDNPDVALFKFPIQKKRCEAWIEAILRPELAAHSVSHLNQNYAVCANHFKSDQFAGHERRLLTRTAIPTVVKNDGDNLPVQEIQESLEDERMLNTEDGQSENFIIEPVGLPNDDTVDDVMARNEHPGALCRLCANTMDGPPFFIFGNEGERSLVAHKINACLPISVKKTDALPKQICQVCLQHLELQNSFVETCIKADKKLKSLAQHFLVNNLKIPVSSGQSKTRQNYCCPLCCSGGMRYVPNPDCPTSEGDAQNTVHVDGKDVQLMELYSDDGEPEEAAEPEVLTVDPLEENQAAPTFLLEDKLSHSYECYVCEELFDSPFYCFEHCKIHSTTNYYPCLVCGLVLSSLELLKEHFVEHKTSIPTPRRSSWRPLLECGTCAAQFTTRKEFILHKCSMPVLRTVHTDAWELGCQSCGRVFKNSARAADHQVVHQAGGDLPTCSHCGFETESTGCLEDHIMTVHSTPPLHSCTECLLQFHSAQHLEKHMKVHQTESNMLYQCSVCSKTFTDLEPINQHIEMHAAQSVEVTKTTMSQQCPKCDQSFLHKSHLQHHMETFHDSMKRMPSLIHYQCKVCKERITSSAEVLIHRTVHWKSPDPSLPHVCEYCGEAHPSPNSLARHRRIIHPNEHPYVCTICDVSTRTLYEARVHRKVHTGYESAPNKPQPKIYQCEHCPSLFSERTSFLAHKKTHKVNKWFQCEMCEKAFPERHRLVVHRRQHTGEKPYSCGTCGKKFAQTSAMYTHALLHTGETPHSCDICGRKFRIKSDRDNHRRTHTGEKPFKCQYCSKTFRTGQVYYQHRMIHTGERRFPCDVCGRAFKRSHTLVCHRRIHTGEKPNVCDICGKGFRQRTDMRKHKMNLHQVA